MLGVAGGEEKSGVGGVRGGHDGYGGEEVCHEGLLQTAKDEGETNGREAGRHGRDCAESGKTRTSTACTADNDHRCAVELSAVNGAQEGPGDRDGAEEAGDESPRPTDMQAEAGDASEGFGRSDGAAEEGGAVSVESPWHAATRAAIDAEREISAHHLSSISGGSPSMTYPTLVQGISCKGGIVCQNVA